MSLMSPLSNLAHNEIYHVFLTGLRKTTTPLQPPQGPRLRSMDDSQQLFRTRLTYDCVGDHVEEVWFDNPVAINALWVGNACTDGSGQALLRVYAKDVQGPYGGRFVPLCGSTVACPQDRLTRVQTEEVVTDCVVVRGRYEQLDIHFYGRHQTASIENAPKDQDDKCPTSDLNCQPDAIQPSNRMEMTLPAEPNLPYFNGLQNSVYEAVNSLIMYKYQDGGASIPSLEPSDPAVEEVLSAADELCRLLDASPNSATNDVNMEVMANSGSEPIAPLDTFYMEASELCIEWIEKLSCPEDQKTGQQVRMGTVGLGVALLLSSCREAAVHFLSNGGVKALAGGFQIRGVTARMVRYLVCTCEMITLTTSSLGCGALLGWWVAPKSRRRVHRLRTLQQVDEERDVIHVPGILQVKARVRKSDQEYPSKQATMDATPQPKSLPPGMVVARPTNSKSTRSQGSRVSPTPLKMSHQGPEDECSDEMCDRRSGDWMRSKGKRKLEGNRDLAKERQESLTDKYENPDSVMEVAYQRHRESEPRDKSNSSQAKAPEVKPKRSSSDKKESKRRSSKRKEKRKHKSHRKDKHPHSTSIRERKNEERHGVQLTGEDRGRESDEVHSKHKKRRHDDRKKERKKPYPDGHAEELDDHARLVEEGSRHKEALDAEPQKGRKRHRRRAKSTEPEQVHDSSAVDVLTVTSDKGFDAVTAKDQITNEQFKISQGKDGARPSKKHRSDSSDHIDHADYLDTKKSSMAENASMSLSLPGTGAEIYSSLLDVMMQPRAGNTVASTSRVVLRLNAYEAIIKFQESVAWAEQSLKSDMTNDIASNLQNCSDALIRISESIQKLQEISRTASLHDRKLDRCIGACLSSQHFVSTLAAMLAIPAEFSPRNSSGATQMRQAVSKGFCSIVASLIGTTYGLALFKNDVFAVMDMVSSLDPHDRSNCVDMVEEVVVLVRDVLRACEAVDIIVRSSTINSVIGAGAISTLNEMLVNSQTRRAAILAMKSTPDCVPRCVQLLQSRTEFLKTLAKMVVFASGESQDESGIVNDEGGFGSLLVLNILLQTSREENAEIVVRMREIAKDVASAVENEQAMLKETGCTRFLDEGSLELLGRAQMCILFEEKGSAGVMDCLGSILPSSVGCDEKKGRDRKTDPALVVEFFRSSEKLGKVLMGINIILSQLSKRDSSEYLAIIYKSSTPSILERLVECATEALSATQADLQWMLLAGDFRNEITVAMHKNRVEMFVGGVARLLDVWSQVLGSKGVEVHATPLLSSLVELHSLVTSMPESLRSMMGKGTRNCPILKARHSLASTLSRWVELGWGPEVIPAVFADKKDTVKSTSIHSEPQTIFSASCVLGDVFPTPWPPANGYEGRGKSFPPPSHVKTRATLAKALKPCASHVRQIIEFSLGSESQLLRSSVVRLVARAAGLGGGMGVFLAKPLIQQASELSKQDTPISSHHARTAEYLLALSVWPAIKAAFLDLKAGTHVSSLLQCAAKKCKDEPGAHIVAKMLIQTLTFLCSPDICMNSLTPLSERLKTDHPNVAETGNIVMTLVSNLRHLGDLAASAYSLLDQIKSSTVGKSGIVDGVKKWHAAKASTTGSDGASGESSQSPTSWAAAQLREQSAGLQEICQASSRACADVATLVESLEDFERIDEEEASSAPNRFKSAVQAAVKFAASSECGSADGMAFDLPKVHPQALVYDSATQIYRQFALSLEDWKPIRKNWAKWPCEVPDNRPATSFYPRGLSEVSRPRQVQRGVYLSNPSQDGNRRDDPHGDLLLQMMRRHDEAAPEETMPDLPPVFAPPRRGQEARRMRIGAGSSRPPSIHVDAFQKRDDPVSAEQGAVDDASATDANGTSINSDNAGGAKVVSLEPNLPATSDGPTVSQVPSQPLIPSFPPPPPGKPVKSKPFTISLPPRVKRDTAAGPSNIPRDPISAGVPAAQSFVPGLSLGSPPSAADSILPAEVPGTLEASQPPLPFGSPDNRDSPGIQDSKSDSGQRFPEQGKAAPPTDAPPLKTDAKQQATASTGPSRPVARDSVGGLPICDNDQSAVATPPGLDLADPLPSAASSTNHGSGEERSTMDTNKDLEVLHDPAQVREILKQHPQLVAALQARLRQATVAQDP